MFLRVSKLVAHNVLFHQLDRFNNIVSAMEQTNNDPKLREVLELKIEVPFGYLAAKWWGRRDVRPILCVHGWQDNAASFDKLIPLLPDHVGYLAIDLPGHGFSSRLPNGLIYSHLQEIYILNHIIKQFGWTQVSLLGHSMGGVLCFTYAAIYPHMVDLLVELDGLQPRIMTSFDLDTFSVELDYAHANDMKNVVGEEPPVFTFDEMIEKLNSQVFPLSRSSAMCLFARAAKESSKEKGKYYFSRDARLKSFNLFRYSIDIVLSLVDRIECPHLFVKARESHYDIYFDQQDTILKELCKKPNFEWTTVEGDHHVHLNAPHRVSDIVSKFLLKHVNVDGDCSFVGSKL